TACLPLSLPDALPISPGSGPDHRSHRESAAPAHTARDERGGRSPVTVLILGGTAEARALAAELDRRGAAFLSSLAGRVSRPRLRSEEHTSELQSRFDL